VFLISDDKPTGPYWKEFQRTGIRVQLRPIDQAMMISARYVATASAAAAAQEYEKAGKTWTVADQAAVLNTAFNLQLAKSAIVAWEGVGLKVAQKETAKRVKKPKKEKAAVVTEANIEAAMRDMAFYDDFDDVYVIPNMPDATRKNG